MENLNNTIRKIEDLEDGSSVYEIGEEILPQQEPSSFYANLAENDIADEALTKISSYLLDAIEKDRKASELWMASIKRAKEYLGFDIEDIENIPFKESTRTYDTTLANSLIRFYATTRAELLPQAGPAGFRIMGASDETLEQKGEKVTTWLNYYLTYIDKSYYSDFERLILHLGFNGTAFKKVYYDQLLGRPLSRFIPAEDFIIDGDCNSILDSSRLTQVLHLSKREILLNQKKEIYRDVEIRCLKSLEVSEEVDVRENNKDFDTKSYEKRSLFPIYECHVYLDLNDFDNDMEGEEVPLPYIVVVEPTSRQILSIRRNWKEEDTNKKRIEYFVQYNYLPGFGVRGLGLAHLVGTNAISLTTILRELIDAGKFKNLPGGLRMAGMKQQNNDLVVGVGQFVEVETGQRPLQEVFMPLPYSEPSQTLRELRIEVMNQTKELSSSSEMGMLDSREDIPTGTAIAFLETNNRIQSAVLRSIHFSLTQELQLIDKIFRETLDNDFTQHIGGEEITRNDFADEVEIIPISDPTVNSTIQRIMKAQATMQLASQDPELHSMREVFKMSYKAQGLTEQDIDKILKPEPTEEEVLPLDPVSENINIMMGKPVKAAIWQDHTAHKMSHAMFGKKYPNLQAEVMAHNKEHDAYEYLLQMEQLLGQALPPLEQLQNPEVQNEIALNIASSLNEMVANEEQQAPIDPNALIMADIQQKEAETEARERIAALRAETDIFKAQLDFEREKAKIESNEDIAQLKSETELTKQGIIDE